MFGDQAGDIGEVLSEGLENSEEVVLVVEECRRRWRKGRRYADAVENAMGLWKLGKR